MLYYAKISRVDAGFEHDKEAIKSLNSYIYYPISRLEVERSISYFQIKGMPEYYNTVNFDFYDENMKPVNILDTELNNYHDKYSF